MAAFGALESSLRKVKHHPALLMWVAGNESGPQRIEGGGGGGGAVWVQAL